MSRIRTIIVDDEPLARRAIKHLLARDSEIHVVARCRNGVEAVKQISTMKPDLVFLDVQMPGMSGFEVMQAVGVENMPLTVFVTAYDTYALKAFDMQALDYLLKPFEDSRFEQTLRRAKKALSRYNAGSSAKRFEALLERHQSQSTIVPHDTSRIVISSNGKVVFLKTEGVDWISAADYYVQIHSQKKTFLHRQTMNDLEKQLDPEKFVRVHRSAIVNVDRVKELRPTPNGDHIVTLNDGTELKVSRRRRHRLRGLL